MLRRLISFLVFLWVIGGAVEAAEIADSVVLLYEQDGDGSLKFACTATAFREAPDKPRLFLSAAHCVSVVSTKVPGTKEVTKNTLYLTLDDPDEKKYVKATVKTLGSEGDGYDLSILESKLDAPTLLLGDEKTLRPGSEVAAITASLGLGRGYTKGYVAIPKLDRPLVDETRGMDWRGAILCQLNVMGGASGSALVSVPDNKIVGVVVGGMRGFTIAIPVSKLQEILVPPKSGETKK